MSNIVVAVSVNEKCVLHDSGNFILKNLGYRPGDDLRAYVENGEIVVRIVHQDCNHVPEWLATE